MDVPQDVKNGSIVKFEWKLWSDKPGIVIEGKLVDKSAGELVIEVYDTNLRKHEFHVSPNDVLEIKESE